MPRSLQNIIDHADELAARAEELEPNGDGHPEAVARLRHAVVQGAEAERELTSAIRAAREDDMSWAAIGVVVGMSGEAVRKRETASRSVAQFERTV
ncbi:hypothetical protein BH20ACT4_BH20ACT4_14860 [soil metagenome]